MFVFFSSISLFHITLYASLQLPYSASCQIHPSTLELFLCLLSAAAAVMGYHLLSILPSSLFNWVYILLKGIRPNTLIDFHSFMFLGKCDYRHKKPFSDFHLYYVYEKDLGLYITFFLSSTFLPPKIMLSPQGIGMELIYEHAKKICCGGKFPSIVRHFFYFWYIFL